MILHEQFSMDVLNGFDMHYITS